MDKTVNILHNSTKVTDIFKKTYGEEEEGKVREVESNENLRN